MDLREAPWADASGEGARLRLAATRAALARLDAHTLDIHRVVQKVVKAMIDKETQRLWAERIVRAVGAVFPSGEVATWPVCERLLPHAQVCAELIDTWHFRGCQ